MFAIGDALVLQAMLRIRRPERVIEVGSGWSSAVMLDTAERFLQRRPELVFIEPYPANLEAVLRDGDRSGVTIHARPVQDVEIELFDSLGPGDILFIDSSHVVKPGSDVNHLYFDVLPRLAPGVAVHVHDIFFPFEVPDPWLAEGRMWGETYLLRALLTGTAEWTILIWNDYLGSKHHEAVMAALPAAAPNTGASIWMERRASA
jgi:predicted O-methyltransferase YrrM